MNFYYGIMQGRLSKRIDNKVQAFPKENWRLEFEKAKKLGLKSIEWTLDSSYLQKNPIFTQIGQETIKKLSKKYSIKVDSITCDYFMEKPFWKIKKNEFVINYLKKILNSCKILNIKFLVIPLVDKGSIKNFKERKNLLKICKTIIKYLRKSNVKIIFESDFPPEKLKKFIFQFDKRYFGINYDVGNSAGLNYDIDKEFKCYGSYICNVHIKERYKNGVSIKLGQGNANFYKLFENLKKIKFKRNLILQTARSKKNRHMIEVKNNLDYLYKVQNG